MTNTIPTRFTLMVTKSPFDARNAHSALSFCAAAIEQGHSITQVFFYQKGVHNASSLLQPNADELDVYSKWCDLAKKHAINLNVCVTAASRRGVVDAQLAPEPNYANLVWPFTQVGLTAYFEALNNNSVNIQL